MAGSLNKVILIGNLGADPEIKSMPDGTKMARFSIATTERYTNKLGEKIANTEWHNIVLWRRQAEVAEQYLHKGDSVCIEGRLKTRSWEDENGTKKYATDIQGDSMTMLGKKRDTDNDQQVHTEEKTDINQSNLVDNSATSQDDPSKDAGDLPF